MQTYHIVMTAVYAVTLLTYFFVEVRDNLFPARAVVKIFMALLYLSMAIVNTTLAPDHLTFKIVLCVACLFAFCGDALLLFKKVRSVGVGFFLVANILIAVCQLLLAQTVNPVYFLTVSLPIFVVFFGGLSILLATKYVSFGKETAPVLIYIGVMTLTGSVGIAMAIAATAVKTMLFGIGVGLFMLSDYLLGAYRYKFHKKQILVSNSATYFSGMFLIALSLFF